jgi:hypothetical protein
LSSASVLKGDDRARAHVELAEDAWQVLVVNDFKTNDGELFVYLGLLSNISNSHVFDGNKESLLYGGAEVILTPAVTVEPVG